MSGNKHLIIDERSSFYNKENNLYVSEVYIQKRINEITAEIKELSDGSMKTSFKLTALRAVKKELKSLLVSK